MRLMDPELKYRNGRSLNYHEGGSRCLAAAFHLEVSHGTRENNQEF
jgi:hypothetical protein